MAWTTPTSYSTGQILTAAGLNTQLVDNLKSLRGLNDKAVRVYLDVSDLTISNSTVEPGTAITWQAALWNIGSMWSSGTNPSRITPAQIGYYAVGGAVNWQGNASGSRFGKLYQSGTTAGYSLFHEAGFTGGFFGGNQITPFYAEMSVTSTALYYELKIRQNTGVSIDIRSGLTEHTHMSFRLLGTT